MAHTAQPLAPPLAASTDEQEQPLLPISSSEKAGKKPTTEDEPSAADLLAGFTTFALFIFACVYFPRHFWQRIFGPFDPVEYTITIAAVSGLDPATDLQPHARPAAPPPLLDPAFNLTLRVASPSTAFDRECIVPGTTVEVSYLRSGVPLATGPTPAFCVEVGEEREEGSVVAWGEGVRLPGFVLDSLAADMRRGAAEFGVKLTEPVPYCGGGGASYDCSSRVRVISCWARIGGGRAPYKISFETASFPVPRPGRDSGSLPQPTQ